MKTLLRGIFYSFPVQLFLLHLKRSHFLLLFWILILLFITGAIGSRYGIDLLFLDPEYLGNVGMISFFILGFAFGGFFIVWNLTSYMLHARYFSFLATLNRPFGIYCLNNAIIPIIFLLLFIYKLIKFQASEGLFLIGETGLCILGFFLGALLIILISMLYFFNTNKNILQITNGKKRNIIGYSLQYDETTHVQANAKNQISVEYYLNHALKTKLTRSVDHYPESVIRTVYKQHHSNALFIEITCLILILCLSLLIDYPAFRIPAGSSIILLCTIILMLAGAFSYWMGKWKLFFLVLLIVVVNFFIKLNLFQYHNKAFGLNYETTTNYDYETLQNLSNDSVKSQDKKNTLEIFENWKNKFEPNRSKPKIIFLNVSGGGLRSSMYVMKTLQNLDSISDSKFMNHCFLITGASGGMLSAAYFRELYKQKSEGKNISLSDNKYLENISHDLLNPVGYSLVVNDLFYPWQKFSLNGTTHHKDRGYIFEKALNENTESMFDKPLQAFADAEKKAQIPMMLFYPTILNDERKLFISTQSVSYLCAPNKKASNFSKVEIDGVDFRSLFENQDADKILFSTILRMNCTFPYILPNVHLPTTPGIEVLDAGIRDNYGIEVSSKFISEFAAWIDSNTSGVIVVNIRGIEQIKAIEENVTQGVFEKLFSPIGTLYNNWVEIQDYQNESTLFYLDQILKTDLDIITFEYLPENQSKRASLSFHLTAKEKRDILFIAENIQNKNALNALNLLLEK